MSLYLSASISQNPDIQTTSNFLCMFPVAVSTRVSRLRFAYFARKGMQIMQQRSEYGLTTNSVKLCNKCVSYVVALENIQGGTKK